MRVGCRNSRALCGLHSSKRVAVEPPSVAAVERLCTLHCMLTGSTRKCAEKKIVFLFLKKKREKRRAWLCSAGGVGTTLLMILNKERLGYSRHARGTFGAPQSGVHAFS